MSRHWTALALAAGLGGCGTLAPHSAGFDRIQTSQTRRNVALSPVEVSWRQRVTPEFSGDYEPVERAQAALDPGRDRVYVGSSAGILYAMNGEGSRLYRYTARGPIESGIAFDPVANRLYFPTSDGHIHALDASSGESLWRVETGAPVTRTPQLTDDAVYILTDTDKLIALSREDGSVLWSFDRPMPDGFTIAEHSGITLHEGQVFAGFTNGGVYCLDQTDGSVVWNYETIQDIDEGRDQQYTDIETTPIVIGETVYAASFSAGLYAFDAGNGTVRWRDETMTGVVGLAETRHGMVVASADRGVVHMDLDNRQALWRVEALDGAPSPPVVSRGKVLFGETQGSFVILSVESGRELARVHDTHGFSGAATVAGDRGFIVSNSGSLFALSL